MKLKLVSARQDLRVSNAARARALSTANKTIAFARQAVQVRVALEAQLSQAQEALNNRQTIVSSLICSLEEEKRRTQHEIESLANQILQNQTDSAAITRDLRHEKIQDYAELVVPVARDLDQGKAS